MPEKENHFLPHQPDSWSALRTIPLRASALCSCSFGASFRWTTHPSVSLFFFFDARRCDPTPLKRHMMMRMLRLGSGRWMSPLTARTRGELQSSGPPHGRRDSLEEPAGSCSLLFWRSFGIRNQLIWLNSCDSAALVITSPLAEPMKPPRQKQKGGRKEQVKAATSSRHCLTATPPPQSLPRQKQSKQEEKHQQLPSSVTSVGAPLEYLNVYRR